MRRRSIGLAVAVALSVMTASCTDRDGAPDRRSPESARSATPRPKAAPGRVSAARAKRRNDQRASRLLLEAAGVVQRYSAQPSPIGPDVPLTRQPPPALTVAWLECDAPSCTDTGDAIRQATDALGWKLEVLPYRMRSPQTLASALDRAAALAPVAVLGTTLEGPGAGDGEAKLAAAGIPLVVAETAAPPERTAGAIAVLPMQRHAEAGKVLAAWTAASSSGTAQVLLVVPESGRAGPSKVFAGTFRTELTRLCSSCSTEELATPDAVWLRGDVGTEVAKAKQRKPALTHVVFASGDLSLGTASALRVAGLSGTLVTAGHLPRVFNRYGLASGGEAAWTDLSPVETGWRLVDAAVRLATGQKPDALGAPNVRLLMAGSGPEPDYAPYFRGLWFGASSDTATLDTTTPTPQPASTLLATPTPTPTSPTTGG